MDKDVEKIIRVYKRRKIMWSILAVLVYLLGVGLIVMVSIIPEMPKWAKAMMGVLTFVSGHAFTSFATFASLEDDLIDDLEKYNG